jgi:hypothetical protein
MLRNAPDFPKEIIIDCLPVLLAKFIPRIFQIVPVVALSMMLLPLGPGPIIRILNLCFPRPKFQNIFFNLGVEFAADQLDCTLLAFDNFSSVNLIFVRKKIRKKILV